MLNPELSLFIVLNKNTEEVPDVIGGILILIKAVYLQIVLPKQRNLAIWDPSDGANADVVFDGIHLTKVNPRCFVEHRSVIRWFDDKWGSS